MKQHLLIAGCLALAACSPTPAVSKDEGKQPAPPSLTVAAKPAGAGTILRLDDVFDRLVPNDAKIERVATGFQFTEGPLFFPETGALWFSDVQGNVIRQISKDGSVAEILRPGGSDDNSPGGGPNGLAFDKAGNVLICQHGNRRIARRSPAGIVTTLVDRFEGKRLNSPNDVVVKSDGSVYFTDPPYGLPKQDEDPKKELAFNGIYRLKNGKLTVESKEQTRPNGLAFSPDEGWLYVANSDAKKKVWMKYPVGEDGSLGVGRLFAEVRVDPIDTGLPDGLKVDANGNVWATGPGGVWVFSPDGKQLGSIQPTEVPANLTFAKDGAVLWMTARTSLYRLVLQTKGDKK